MFLKLTNNTKWYIIGKKNSCTHPSIYGHASLKEPMKQVFKMGLCNWDALI